MSTNRGAIFGLTTRAPIRTSKIWVTHIDGAETSAGRGLNAGVGRLPVYEDETTWFGDPDPLSYPLESTYEEENNFGYQMLSFRYDHGTIPHHVSVPLRGRLSILATPFQFHSNAPGGRRSRTGHLLWVSRLDGSTADITGRVPEEVREDAARLYAAFNSMSRFGMFGFVTIDRL